MNKINELEMKHMHREEGFWEASEKVAKRLKTNSKHWKTLHTIPRNKNISVKVWSKVSEVLSNCSDSMFNYFLDEVYNSSEIKLDKILEIASDSNRSGEEIVAFILNLINSTPTTIKDGKRDNKALWEKIKQEIQEDNDLDLKFLDKHFEYTDYEPNFISFEQRHMYLK